MTLQLLQFRGDGVVCRVMNVDWFLLKRKVCRCGWCHWAKHIFVWTKHQLKNRIKKLFMEIINVCGLYILMEMFYEQGRRIFCDMKGYFNISIKGQICLTLAKTKIDQPARNFPVSFIMIISISSSQRINVSYWANMRSTYYFFHSTTWIVCCSDVSGVF